MAKWLNGFLKYVFKYVFLLFLFLVVLATSVSAAPPRISEVPQTINADQSFNVMVNLVIQKSVDEKKYLRAAFAHPTAVTSYFGYTKNHFDQWYNGEPKIDPRKFKEVQMGPVNSWDGYVEVRPDPENSRYKGSGTYNFKIAYYTETGTSVTEWSDVVQINIEGAASTNPTPSPSPSPSPSPTPDASPSPSPSPKPSLSPKPSISPSPKVLGAAKTRTPTPASPSLGGPSPMPTLTPKDDKLVLGQATTASPSPQAQPTSRFGGNTYLAFGLMGLGLVLIVFSAYTFLKPKPSDTITIDS